MSANSKLFAESPELLQVAMDQGIPLSELYGEPATAEPEDNSGHISSLPAASAGVIEHPDVKNADVRGGSASQAYCFLCQLLSLIHI